jgi:Protein of unknown function (DUF1800)
MEANVAGQSRKGQQAPGVPFSATATPISWVNDLTPIPNTDWNYSRAAHLLERAGFGGTPEEVERLSAMKPEQAVDYLVDYEPIDASNLPGFTESAIYPRGFKYISIYQVLDEVRSSGTSLGVQSKSAPPLDFQPPIDEYYTLLWCELGEMRRAAQWWAERMLITPRPLEEKLALFWHNHFATSQQKVLNYEFMLRQIEMLRRLALGNLRDLLIGIAQDQAMLIWLDNKDNVKGQPNENFAREVMELFSMGEGQGYTEKDIREMARAFTGWTATKGDTTQNPGKFVDDPEKHDDGVKSFLGATGNFNGYDAIDIILKQAAPARFITGKLYRYFVREDIAPELNEKLAKLLRDQNYELKPLLKTILLSRDFYSEQSVGTQIKSPVALLVSTYRKMGLQSIPGIPDFNETTLTLGQSLFFPPNVAGWAGGRTWINPATLLARSNFIESLLFPDPENFVDPQKEISESYRRIPLKYTHYNVMGHIWDPQTQRMEPVPLAVYDRYLAGMSLKEARSVPDGTGSMGSVSMDAPAMDAPKSRMSVISNNERYNLAVGVYTGAWQANARVMPFPRTPAQVDFTRMARDAGAETVEEAVNYFSGRFLSLPLPSDRYRAVTSFLKGELKSDQLNYSDAGLKQALRLTVHLILSAPEYQLH